MWPEDRGDSEGWRQAERLQEPVLEGQGEHLGWYSCPQVSHWVAYSSAGLVPSEAVKETVFHGFSLASGGVWPSAVFPGL